VLFLYPISSINLPIRLQEDNDKIVHPISLTIKLFLFSINNYYLKIQAAQGLTAPRI